MDTAEPTVTKQVASAGEGSVALAWFRLLHPFPSFLVTIASGVFAEMAAAGHAPADRLLRLVVSVICSQFAIGSANDVVDRHLDLVTKPWKPVARGIVSVSAATTLAVVLSLACLVLSTSISLSTGLAAAVGLSCGLSYDLWFKRSRWSWLPYGLAIPTLPVWSWAAMGKLNAHLLPVYPLGLLLGLSLHLANTLPDLEGDTTFGVQGLAHGWGRRRSLAVCWGSMALAQTLTLALAPVLHYHGVVYPIGLAVSGLLLLISVLLYRLRPTASTLQVNFGVLALASLALAAGWLGGAVA
ncbi:MAG: UbiA prenyltransferase [Chloroflexi bacterium]|nr:UbiA prenyltransferase [Chloroflexota bacterium]